MRRAFLMLMLAVAMTATAQGSWEKVTKEADELKGEKGGDVFIFTDENVGSFVYWGDKINQFRLISSKSQFDINAGYSSFTGSYAFVTVLVGFYDADGKLLEKFEMNLDRENNAANSFLIANTSRVGAKKKMQKIFKALQSGSGYVRMVAPRFNTTDFDLKILPYEE